MGAITDTARSTAVESLTAQLRGRILEGDFAPGTRLVERELTEAHRTSRPTVRSALRALAAEGLVTIEPHRGASVSAFSRSSLSELFELRTALEVEAARIALARNPDGLQEDLQQAVDTLTARCRRPREPFKRIAAAHTAIHDAIAAAAGNERLHAAHRALAGELNLFMLHLKPVWSREELARHHERLARELFEQGEDALRRHLEEGESAVAGA